MWVSIIGADGSGKNAVRDHLVENHKYQDLSVAHEASELKTLAKRMDMHHEAHKASQFENILSIRTAVDSVDFYPEYLLKTEAITKEEHDCLITFKDYVLRRLPLPDCVIFLETDFINAHNRIKLKNNNQLLSDYQVNLQSEIYLNLSYEIALPLIRVQANTDFLMVLNEIDFGLNSIRVANLQNRSIFRRDYYR